MIAVTLQGADAGDTTTIIETAIAAAEQIEDAQADVTEPQTFDEIIADKGYHSNQTMVDLDAVGLRSYIAEPDRGRRDWSEAPAAQAPVLPIRLISICATSAWLFGCSRPSLMPTFYEPHSDRVYCRNKYAI